MSAELAERVEGVEPLLLNAPAVAPLGRRIPVGGYWDPLADRASCRADISLRPLFRGLPFRCSGYPALKAEFLRGTVQHDEVSDFPSKGRLLASLGLSLVSFLTVRLPPVPRDDNGKLRCFSRESVETSQSPTADDDTNRLLR
jgi:hypothetical protein